MGIGWPLVGSAAGHVLALACGILLMRAPPAPPLAGIVEVRLVEGSPAITPEGGKSVFAFGGEEHRARGILPGADRILPSAPDAAPFLPSPMPPGVSPAGGTAVIAKEPARASAGPVPQSSPGADLPTGRGASVSLPVGIPGKEKIAGAGTTAGGASGEETVQRFPAQAGPPAGRTLSALLPAAAGGGAGGGEQGAVRLLRDRIEARIVYPEEAVRRGQEGVVLLRIRVGEGGIPKEVRVAQSSGARVLDEAARTGVVRAAPLPSIPGWFEVPVRFLLR